MKNTDLIGLHSKLEIQQVREDELVVNIRQLKISQQESNDEKTNLQERLNQCQNTVDFQMDLRGSGVDLPATNFNDKEEIKIEAEVLYDLSEKKHQEDLISQGMNIGDTDKQDNVEIGGNQANAENNKYHLLNAIVEDELDFSSQKKSIEENDEQEVEDKKSIEEDVQQEIEEKKSEAKSVLEEQDTYEIGQDNQNPKLNQFKKLEINIYDDNNNKIIEENFNKQNSENEEDNDNVSCRSNQADGVPFNPSDYDYRYISPRATLDRNSNSGKKEVMESIENKNSGEQNEEAKDDSQNPNEIRFFF